MPWCRFRSLLTHLPRESATVRAVEGDRARWGESEHLLAVLIDLVQAQVWQFAAANSKKRPKRPKPYPRPGVVDPSRRRFGGGKRMTLDEARAWAARKRGGARDGD